MRHGVGERSSDRVDAVATRAAEVWAVGAHQERRKGVGEGAAERAPRVVRTYPQGAPGRSNLHLQALRNGHTARATSRSVGLPDHPLEVVWRGLRALLRTPTGCGDPAGIASARVSHRWSRRGQTIRRRSLTRAGRRRVRRKKVCEITTIARSRPGARGRYRSSRAYPRLLDRACPRR